jgi:hypothetical protein
MFEYRSRGKLVRNQVVVESPQETSIEYPTGTTQSGVLLMWCLTEED